MTVVDPVPHERGLRRNVTVGIVGMLARGAHLALLFAIGHAFGSAVLGRFLFGVGLFEVAAAVVVTGFTDGTMLLVSRQAARLGHVRAGGANDAFRALADIVASALRVGGGVALALAIATTLLAGPLARRSTGPYAEVLSGAMFLAWALVPSLLARLAFAGTTAFLRLEWEAIVGAAGPSIGLLLALPVVHGLHGGVRGLFVALLLAQTLTAGVAVWVLRRHLPLSDLWAAWRRRRIDRGLLRFALPQSLNMAATTYIARMDVLLLAALGLPASVVGSYGALAALVLELRQARQVVSGALGALVARQHAAGAPEALRRTLSRTAAWVASTAVPLALGFVVVRGDVLALVAPGYTGDSAFVLILLVGPLINCLGGLAGNFLVYTLHNRWNLANSIFVAVLNTALGWLLVPRLGLVGAAISGTAAMALVTVLENVELAALERVYIAPRALAPAAITLATGGTALWAMQGLHLSLRRESRIELALGGALVAALILHGWPGPARRLGIGSAP